MSPRKVAQLLAIIPLFSACLFVGAFLGSILQHSQIFANHLCRLMGLGAAIAIFGFSTRLLFNRFPMQLGSFRFLVLAILIILSFPLLILALGMLGLLSA